jgi:hypothetical protein
MEQKGKYTKIWKERAENVLQRTEVRCLKDRFELMWARQDIKEVQADSDQLDIHDPEAIMLWQKLEIVRDSLSKMYPPPEKMWEDDEDEGKDPHDYEII